MDINTIRFANPAENFDAALQREWLETNGLGGFASGAILGIHTRRYHGLLTAATKPPVGRVLLLSKLEETLVVNGVRYELGANQYPGAIFPRGFEHLAEFRLDPLPVFVYRAGGVELEKRVFMVQGENTTVVNYSLRGAASECSLKIKPLIAFRDYHSTTHENSALDHNVQQSPGMATVAPYADLPALHFGHNATSLVVFGEWYRNFEYALERERGLDFQEDLFQPFRLTFDLNISPTATVIASTEPRNASQGPAFEQAERERRAALRANAPIDDPLIQDLTAAAGQFLVQRGNLKTVIAGYHWFADWGRDTMISLPGLTLVTGRASVAKDILLAFAASVDQGMLPNRFPDSGETPEYNTVDATLWFIEAVRSYLAYTGDKEFVLEQLLPKLKDIIDWHLRGTRYQIHADDDGLLHCGEPGVQLTWMDAKIGDYVVTPRTGKPVEIQALWYNALCVMAELSGDGRYADWAAHAKASFTDKFWNVEEGCLYDAIDGDQRDGAIRPNQIFAVSLLNSMLTPEQARSVVDVVRRELWTPLGLRTLSPRDSRYQPHYEGGVFDRDSAYHQGTVWPWLMGPFISAYVKVNGRSQSSKNDAKVWLRGLGEQMRSFGLAQLPEIADGDAPHHPRGCVAQAWSVAELLRAAVEGVFI